MVKQISSISELQEVLSHAPALGFVPTMGALHAGHLSLVERAKSENARVLVSIFVNPLQFGAGEDLDAYPRPLEQDIALLQSAGADYLFTPMAADMYPEGFKTTVSVAELDNQLCGMARRGHFDGVCTVVAKLFNLVHPERAYFGEKDWQQLTIIRRMAADLALRPQIIAVPTLREVDGLAMSSRNRYLSEQQRAIAPALYQTLQTCAQAIRSGEQVIETLRTGERHLLQKGFEKIDYLQLCDGETLLPLSAFQKGARLFAAAHLGRARLIDNIALEE